MPVVPSPLAGGPTDPLIRAYFQVDTGGRVSLPTLNDELRDPALQPDAERQREIRRALADAVPAALALIEKDAAAGGAARGTGGTIARQGRRGATAVRAAPVSARPASEADDAPRPARQQVVVDPVTYAINLQANQIYAQLKRSPGRRPALLSTPVRGRSPGIVIGVTSLRWITTTIGGKPTLAALRVVTTPGGPRAQGFVLTTESLEPALGGPPLEAHWALTSELPTGSPAAPVGGTSWSVVLDPAEGLDHDGSQADALLGRFHRDFALGTLAALLAMSGVMALLVRGERVARKRSRFVAAAAQELKAPLTDLRMHGEMLVDVGDDPERVRACAARMAAEAERLHRVVGNVLGFTRLERGLLRVNLEPGDLAAIVREAAERQRAGLEEVGVRLTLAIADDLPAFHFDHEAVAHIVQNLLDNAERHTRGVSDRRVELELSRTSEGADLTVRDYGSGVSDARARRLFAPRTGAPSAAGATGLGLGLALVAALARAHGGSVAHESPEGSGALFRVSFPVLAEASRRTPRAAA
jgi:signal transduction histidine kinase